MLNPDVTIETLIPDFYARPELIQKVIDVKPEVISHNMDLKKGSVWSKAARWFALLIVQKDIFTLNSLEMKRASLNLQTRMKFRIRFPSDL